MAKKRVTKRKPTRRTFTEEYKKGIVVRFKSMKPGGMERMTANEIAEEEGITTGMVHAWDRKYRDLLTNKDIRKAPKHKRNYPKHRKGSGGALEALLGAGGTDLKAENERLKKTIVALMDVIEANIGVTGG